ncbi:MAG: Nif3-like dinuclear metal center hexameric protein [Firmicutes bacterium]|nr:Nif3-like dinuclear metal center hexameric protein [Bacillota bacterium]
MELKVRDIVKAINESVPESLQEGWDNSGIQIGFEDMPVTTILTCLEIDEAVAVEAINAGAQMIVSHHPLIFGGIKRIDSDDSLGRVIEMLICSGISVYSSHTPFDVVEGGNNDVLAAKLGLTGVETASEDGFLKCGYLPASMSLKDFVDYTADCLNLEAGQIRAAGRADALVKRVGLCTGAGSDFAKAAKLAGCDVMVTGDVKHHEALDVIADGFNIVDAGHYGTEKFFAHSMGQRLEGIFGKNIKIIESNTVTDPFVMV